MSNQDTAVNTTEVADTSTTDSAPVETQTTDETSFESIIESELNSPDNEEDSAEESSEQQADEETSKDTESNEESDDREQEDGPDSTESDEEPRFTKAEQRKEQLNSEIRQMVEYKRQLEQEMAQIQPDQAQYSEQPLTEEQLLDAVNPDTGEYFTPTEARLVLMQQEMQQMRQENQAKEYQAQVERSQAQLATDIESSLKEYPMFDQRNPQYDQALAGRARKFIEASLIKDPNGQIVGTNMPVRDILATFADIQASSMSVGEAKARKATNKMMANVDTGGGASQATTGDAEAEFIDNFFK